MSQEDINKDLNGYLHERKDKSFWNRFKDRPKIKARKDEEIQEELRQDVERVAKHEDAAITPSDRQELGTMEEKIEEVNKVEVQVEKDIEEEHESLLQKFFKKLNFSGAKKDEDDKVLEENSPSENDAATNKAMTEDAYEKEEPAVHIHHELVFESEDEELKEMLRRMHEWVIQLPPEKLAEFKRSEDFELYARVLKKHNLIK